jgi:hypothetical protein
MMVVIVFMSCNVLAMVVNIMETFDIRAADLVSKGKPISMIVTFATITLVL